MTRPLRDLHICFLMALRALDRSLLPRRRFFNMAIDADTLLRHVVMKRQLDRCLHRSCDGLGVTVLAVFLCGFRGLSRLRGIRMKL